jgi:hypothetical protein
MIKIKFTGFISLGFGVLVSGYVTLYDQYINGIKFRVHLFIIVIITCFYRAFGIKIYLAANLPPELKP